MIIISNATIFQSSVLKNMFDISSIVAYSKLDNKGSQTTDHVSYVCENSNLYTTVMIHSIF